MDLCTSSSAVITGGYVPLGCGGSTKGERVRKLAAVGLALVPCSMFAATDITEVISDASTYKDSAIVVGIAILLFVIGRRVVRKLV